jgi:hypothetical protein
MSHSRPSAAVPWLESPATRTVVAGAADNRNPGCPETRRKTLSAWE